MNTDIEINGNMELSKHSPLEQFDDVMEENVEEKAKSKSQQKFFGMVDAYKKGEMPNASPSIKKAADGMSMKQVKDFAKTKHKGLPNHVDESTLRKIIKNILKEVYEVNNQEKLNELSNDTIDNAYIKVMNDVNTLPYGTPKRVRRDAQLKNIKKIRNDKLGFDPVDMSIKMRQQGTSGNPSIDRKWATWQKNHDDRISGIRTYDDKTGRWTTRLTENDLRKIIQETVQTNLVDVLGKYTQGKTSSKEANKAIMDLANSSNKKKLNEEVDARTLEYFNKIRNGECETLEWEGRIFRVPPQLKQIARQVSEEFNVVASPYVYQNDSRIYCALLVDAPEDCDYYTVCKNVKLFLLEYDLHYIGCYHRTIFFVRKILEKNY